MDSGYHLKQHEDAARADSLSMGFHARAGMTRQKLHRFQTHQLNSLVRYAIYHAPFYRELYRSIDTNRSVRLEALPVITRQTVMEHFDGIVTDPPAACHNL